MHKMLSAFFCAALLFLTSTVDATGENTIGQSQGVESALLGKSSMFDSRKAWDEFESQLRFRYAYLERNDFNVDTVLAAARLHAEKTSSALEFRRVLQQLTYAFTDPHFIIGPFENESYNIIPTSSDIIVKIKDTQVFVKDIRAGSAADKAGIRPGWEIIEIDQVPALVAARRPFGKLVADPTKKQLIYGATLAINGKRKGQRNIRFKIRGQEIFKTLPSPREFALEVSRLPLLSIDKLGSIGVIRINNSLGNNEVIEAFDKTLDSFEGLSGWVLDLRNTPSGGNTEVARSILGHFISETRSYQVHEIPSYDREFSVPRRFIEQVKPRKPYINPKRVVVLASYWTGSMGEGLVIGLDAAANTYSIGTKMGGLLGGLRNIDLEQSSARMDLGDEALFHVNGTPRHLFSATQLLPSAERDVQGKDPALEAAMKYLKNSK